MKNRNGFTLMELLVVVSIIAVVGVSAVISFANIKDDTAEEELKNKYKEIQRAANLWLDLNGDDELVTNRIAIVDLLRLKESNYISTDLRDPVSGEDISIHYQVLFCITKDDNNQDVVDSCIVDPTPTGYVYIADSYGVKGGHCCEG